MNDLELNDGLHLTTEPSITEWMNRKVKERIVVPSGQITDYSSIPEKGLLGWMARRLGFKKDAPYFTRSGKIHDCLYFALKHWGGVLPPGWYQYFNPYSNRWENTTAYQWTRQQADAIWRRVCIEDGCPEAIAKRGYRFLRLFGGWHMQMSA